MSQAYSEIVNIDRTLIPIILGNGDKNLRAVKSAFNVNIAVMGEEFTFTGAEDDVQKAVHLISQFSEMASKGVLKEGGVEDALRMLGDDHKADIKGVLLESIKVAGKAKSISPKSPKQKEYLTAIRDKDMVFGIGPAGTGKTYLAMAMGVHLFLKKKVSRIILTRPAVEAGESLGFLPGDIAEKINPYLRPLYDALYSMMNIEQVAALVEKNIIEVAPLAFMRGRTLNDSFIILDEAQNTTGEQMKMFLTRLGFRSKAVITGDITQIDLPTFKKSGLVLVRDVLKDIDEIAFIEFSKKDVVRHSLVQKIIQAYESFEEQK